MIGILSPDAIASQNVKNEWAWAIDNNRPLILLLYKQCQIPHRYSRRKYIDFTRNVRRAYTELRQDLLKRKNLLEPTQVNSSTEIEIDFLGPIEQAPQDLELRIARNLVGEWYIESEELKTTLTLTNKGLYFCEQQVHPDMKKTGGWSLVKQVDLVGVELEYVSLLRLLVLVDEGKRLEFALHRIAESPFNQVEAWYQAPTLDDDYTLMTFTRIE